MPSKPNILIVGPSGSGKSSSLEQLFKSRASDVAFIDLERKGMPFLYNPKSLGFYAEPEDMLQAQSAMTAAKGAKASIVVYDSFQKYLEYVRDYSKSKFTGWDIWTNYNNEIGKFMKFMKSMDKLVIVLAGDEVVYIEQAEGTRLSRVRASVPWGKEWEGKIEKEFLIVLFCYAKRDKEGKVRHYFAPHTDGITSAKTPQWLQLGDDIKNDVSLVVDKLVEAKQI